MVFSWLCPVPLVLYPPVNQWQAEQRRREARGWALAKAFLVAHGLPPDGSRLARRAAAGDWIQFLVEASSRSYPHDMVCVCSPHLDPRNLGTL